MTDPAGDVDRLLERIAFGDPDALSALSARAREDPALHRALHEACALRGVSVRMTPSSHRLAHPPEAIWSRDGARYAQFEDNVVTIAELGSDGAIAKIARLALESRPERFVFDADGRSVVSVSERRAQRWLLPRGERPERPVSSGWIYGFPPRGALSTVVAGAHDVVVAATSDGAFLWDAPRAEVRRIGDSGFAAEVIDVSPDAELVVVGGPQGAGLFTAADGRPIEPLAPRTIRHLRGARFSPDGRALVLQGWDDEGSALVAEIFATGTSRGRELGRQSPNVPMQPIAFSPDGRFVAVLGAIHAVRHPCGPVPIDGPVRAWSKNGRALLPTTVLDVEWALSDAVLADVEAASHALFGRADDPDALADMHRALSRCLYTKGRDDVFKARIERAQSAIVDALVARDVAPFARTGEELVAHPVYRAGLADDGLGYAVGRRIGIDPRELVARFRAGARPAALHPARLLAPSGMHVIDRELSIGIASDADVRLEGPNVSGRHCIVSPTGGGYLLCDLGAPSGTKVNHEPISRRFLQHGDRIRLGTTELVFWSADYDPPSHIEQERRDIVLEADVLKMRVERLARRPFALPPGDGPARELIPLLDETIDRFRAVAGAIVTPARGGLEVLARRLGRTEDRHVHWPIFVPEHLLNAAMTERALITCHCLVYYDPFHSYNRPPPPPAPLDDRSFFFMHGRPEAMYMAPLVAGPICVGALWLGAWDYPSTSDEVLADFAGAARDIANALAPWVEPSQPCVVFPLDACAHVELLQERTTIGRHPDNTIPLRDRLVSKMHAQITRSNARWLLADVGSLGGTFVNGGKLNGERALEHGDRITIGQTELVFLARDAVSTIREASARSFSVLIEYREPTFEAQRGSGPRLYRGTFDVEARDEEEAREIACAEFRRIEALSSVGWVREIVSVTTGPARSAVARPAPRAVAPVEIDLDLQAGVFGVFSSWVEDAKPSYAAVDGRARGRKTMTLPVGARLIVSVNDPWEAEQAKRNPDWDPQPVYYDLLWDGRAKLAFTSPSNPHLYEGERLIGIDARRPEGAALLASTRDPIASLVMDGSGPPCFDDLARLEVPALHIEGMARAKGQPAISGLTFLRALRMHIGSASALEALVRLEALDLSHSTLSDLDALEGLTRLRELVLCDCGLLRSVRGVRDLPLELLDLSRTKGLSVSSLADLASLRLLRLRHCHWMRALEALNDLAALEDLDVSFSDSLESLNGVPATLRRLNAIDCPALRDVSALARCRSLVALHLGGSSTIDLAPIEALPALASVSLGNTAVADYRPLLTLPKLAHLNVYRSHIPKEIVSELERRRPECKIIR